MDEFSKQILELLKECSEDEKEIIIKKIIDNNPIINRTVVP